MKALEFLKTILSIETRAEAFAKSIKRDIQRDVIDTLLKKKETYEDRLFELKDFTLFNSKDKTSMTKEECKARFVEIIETEFKLKMLEAELKTKQESFDNLFAE